MTDTVLVTGASGFLAGHVVRALQAEGYAVRGTVRSAEKGAALRDLHPGVEVAEADLTRDEGWAEAASGCAYVLHTASPFPMGTPDSRDALVRPAVDGTRRVIRAAKGAGAQRVVVTSSVAAIAYGQGGRGDGVFTEDDWTDPDAVGAYPASKTLAERAAWDLAREEGVEMATVNPSLILGPLLSAEHGTSVGLVRRMLKGGFPALPRTGFGVVDVRDVARAHVEAMTRPEAAGERFVLSERWMWLEEVAEVLRARFPARKVPTRRAPDLLVKAVALFDSSARQVTGDLGVRREPSGEKAARVLGIDYVSAPEAVAASAHALIEHGLA